MSTFRIRNDFHNTEATIRTASGLLSARQIARVRATLCGHEGCTCGGNLSERGPQEVEIEPSYDGKIIVRPISR